MFDYQRTHNLGELTKQQVAQTVTLSGWVHRRRDHGGVIFIDLRDRFGLTQLVFKPEADPSLHAKANHLRAEWVISVKGKVVSRAAGMTNPNLKTGEIEIEVSELSILSEAQTPPFSVCDEESETNEELRLKYRYLDIRRGKIAKNLITRHKLMQATRDTLSNEGFTEINTPILGKSTPEGARDYLVPSRVTPGSFYALPQSPQLFKQLLMVSGMDRYFQIAPCFRDEDLRADRQPEFAQIDLEMSFVTPEELYPLIEKLMSEIFLKCRGLSLSTPFMRMPFAEAMEKYGTDKPDLRFGMEFVNLTEIAKKSDFQVFLDAAKNNGIVKGIVVKGGADLSRKKIDDYTSFISKFGAHGLAWIKHQPEGPTSGIVKFFSKEVLKELMETAQVEVGDIVLMVASDEHVVNQALDHLRRRVARDRELIDPKSLAFAWITDFPLFSLDKETGDFACEHHPFTSPNPEDIPLLDSDPLKCRSSSYDLVLNGYEIGSGSQRICDTKLQKKIFDMLKLSKEEIEGRFGFFIQALAFGTPPHLGIALGVERITMILCDTTNIRDVIAFPKTQKAFDLMTEAPASVLKQQLSELKIHVEHSTP